MSYLLKKHRQAIYAASEVLKKHYNELTGEEKIISDTLAKTCEEIQEENKRLNNISADYMRRYIQTDEGKQKNRQRVKEYKQRKKEEKNGHQIKE